MKKLFLQSVVALGALIAAAAMPAMAESSTLHVTVPFTFVVNGEKFAAGDYSVSEGSESGILLIQNRTSGHAAAVLSVAGGMHGANPEPSLVF